MSFLRFDPTTADWVVFAPTRKLRPHEDLHVTSSGRVVEVAKCPFCPGNEALTPPEIYSVRDDRDPSRWRVRVIPNRFPALRIEESPLRHTEDCQMFQTMGGCGAHEVIIESPEHTTALAQQSVEQIGLVLLTLKGRYQDLMRDHRFQTVVIFKNHGADAGTSLTHPHWQLIATPVVPHMLRLKHHEATEYFDRTGECMYYAILHNELSVGKRVLAENDQYAAIMPYASHVPFETWIMPKQHRSSFTQVPSESLTTLAEILKTVLLKLHTCLENPAYNLTIDDVPRGDEDKEYFLWHMRILPRLAQTAGFELGSGMSINTMLPEEARAFLSEVPIAS